MERKRKLAEKDQQREAVAATPADERVTVLLDGADSDSGYEGSEAEGEKEVKWAGKKAGNGETESRRRR